jgi:hypothetical protein
LLNEHYELDYLQVPSEHLIGLSKGHIMLVGQFSRDVADEPSGHLKGVLDGVVSSSNSSLGHKSKSN